MPARTCASSSSPRTGSSSRPGARPGAAPGEFSVPHGLAFDSKGRLFVADRANNRLQIFDQEGTFLEEWKQFSRLSGIYIDKNDILYGADSESNTQRHPGWKRGIRVGSVRDGKVTAFIPDPEPKPDDVGHERRRRHRRRCAGQHLRGRSRPEDDQEVREAVAAARYRFFLPLFFRRETSGTSSPSAVARSIWCSCSWRRISRMSSAIAYSCSASHCFSRSR